MATFVEQTPTSRLSRVDVGDTFHASMMVGGVMREWDYVVAESCGNNGGAWYCITHDTSFRNNLEKDSHIRDGEHLLTWVCLEHGPEVP